MNHQSLQAPTLLAEIIIMNCISQTVRRIELKPNNLYISYYKECKFSTLALFVFRTSFFKLSRTIFAKKRFFCQFLRHFCRLGCKLLTDKG